jgi:2-keto-4-pentenoate hydratase/2-oxohepta-3-ene-1,7-dioic acid hydratase in catechol pathway
VRIVTFSVYCENRLGVLTDSGVIDLRQACETYFDGVASSLFSDAKEFLKGGRIAHNYATEVVLTVLDKETRSNERKRGALLNTDSVTLRAPILNPSKIYCPSVNYRSHGDEVGVEPPSEPYFFTKFNNAIIGPGEAIILPPISKKVENEVELAIVIGKKGKYIPIDRAYEHVAGYTVLNDVSFRDLQVTPDWPKVRSPFGQNFIKGKALDTSCPLGPCIVTSDEIPSPYPLKISLRVNGIPRQEGNTEEQIFRVPKMVSYISDGTTLEPGDVISTGVPHRVGKEKVYLKDGDLIEAEVERIGVLKNVAKTE